MVKPKNLASMSLDTLVKLRDDVTAMLGKQAAAIQEQLARLADVDTGGRGGRAPRPSKLKGRRVAVKYRDNNGNTWSGRGAQPRWMTAAIKTGAEQDDFLVGKVTQKSAKKAKTSARKARRTKARKAKPAKRPSKRTKMAARGAKRRVARPVVKAARPAKRPSARPQTNAEAVKQVQGPILQPQPKVDVLPQANSPSS